MSVRDYGVRRAAALLAISLLTVLARVSAAPPTGPTAAGQDKPYIVEWVYKVKWGHSDEFFDIFRKYQIPLLDREKELGNVIRYTVYRPGLHTGEDERWDYRVVIIYRSQQASTHEREVERQLFPDHEALKRE